MKNPRRGKLLSLLLSAALCLSLIPAASAAGSTTVVLKIGSNQMAVNTAVQQVDAGNAAVVPIIENDRTIVPVSRIVAAFGGSSTWDGPTQGTTFSLNGKTVSHTVGTNVVTTPGGKKTMEASSRIIHDRTYIPVRYVLEGLGLNVGYEPTKQLVVVSTASLSGKDLLSLPGSQALLGAQGGGGSAPQGRVLVSAAAPVESKSITKDSVSVQDPYNYMPKSMTFERIEKADDGHQYRKFRGGEDAYDLFQNYVDALCDTGNFTQTDDYYFSYKSSTFFSFALTYTGAGRVSDDKMTMNFKDDVYGDVTIYGTIERSSCEGYIDIVKGLEFDDLGLRSTGESVSTALPGQSLNTDLYRLSDGSYQTGDKRFHVAVGKAQVYRDGTAYTVPAALLRNQDKNREELHIDNFYRNDSILFTAPYNSLLTGDAFDTRTIGLNVTVGYEDFTNSMGSFLDWTFSNKMVGVCHDGDYLYCYRDGGNDFDQVAVRVMYWDAARGEAVIYLCATFDSAPYEYEALAAVRMEAAQADPSGGSGSSSGSSSSGSSSGGSTGSRPRIRCTFIGCDNGKVECSACDGDGGKWVYDNSTPNYSGGRPSGGSRTWQSCSKCHGTGETDCTRCGGDGWIE